MTKCVSNWISALLCLVVGALAVWSPVLPWIGTECVLAVWNAVSLIQAVPLDLLKILHFSLFYALPPLFIIAKQISDLTDTYPALFYLLAVLCLWIIHKLLGLIKVIHTCSFFLLPWATCTAVWILYIHVKMDRLPVGFVLMQCLLKWILGPVNTVYVLAYLLLPFTPPIATDIFGIAKSYRSSYLLSLLTVTVLRKVLSESVTCPTPNPPPQTLQWKSLPVVCMFKAFKSVKSSSKRN